MLIEILTKKLNEILKDVLDNHTSDIQTEEYNKIFNACFELEVTDNGVGYDPSASKGGMGLSSMAERAEKLGGRLEIDSSVGQGTRVHLVIPATIPLDTSGALLLEGEKR